MNFPRRSAVSLSYSGSAASLLLAELNAMLSLDGPGLRAGYPRAGAIDRLSFVLAYPVDGEALGGRLVALGSDISFSREFILNINKQTIGKRLGLEYFNAVLIGLASGIPGFRKYGVRNYDYATMELGVFFGIMHSRLCAKKVENHIIGGADQQFLKECGMVIPEFHRSLGIAV